eukprot:gene19228-21155_t
MAVQGKRAWKLQENVAHGSQVTCLALGPASGRVMVTGGEDRKVNMWAIGKPNVIMSLSGHTSPVESVQFNSSEELVLAGSQSGTLKIWDLEAAKIVRTLTGHKSSIKSLDFHPYGEFVASGSSDTNLKGHTNTVNHLRFSPDGRWIISAGEDGVAKLWDLTAGKILNDFKHHTGAVNRIEFHPKEFLLASCSSDRTVKFWDLETFDLIASTEPEQSAVRTIAFHPDGQCLFSGSQDAFRVYGWEPNRCYESQTVNWGKVSDLSYSSNQLIGASCSQTNVSVWVVDLAHLENLMSKAAEEDKTLRKATEEKQDKEVGGSHKGEQADKLVTKPSPQRKSFNTRPRTTSTKPRNVAKDESAATGDEGPKDFGKQVEDVPNNYESVFKPSSALRRSPSSDRKNPEPFKAPIEESKADDSKPTEVGKSSPVTSAPNSTFTVNDNQPRLQKDVPKQQPPPVQPAQPAEPEPKAPPPQKPVVVQAPYAVHTQQSEPFAAPATVSVPQQPAQKPKIPPALAPVQPRPVATQEQQPAQQKPPQQKPVERPIANAVKSEKAGINVDDFMPVAADVRKDFNNREKAHQQIDEHSAFESLRKSHSSICTIMNARLKNLSIVGQMWTDGEIKAAVQTAASMPDQAVLVDLLNVLLLKQTLWNLDICVALLPELKQMFSSKYESYVETGCNAVKLIMKNFAPVIKSNMAAPPVSMGCDLVREERYIKCKKCHSHLLDIKALTSKLAQSPGRHGALNKQVKLALSVLE